MAGSRTGTGATTTYTFTWTGSNLDAIADAAARRIYAMRNELVSYDTLTLQQKINILDDYIAEMLTENAAIYTHSAEIKAAQAKAQAFIDSNLRMK